MEWNANWIWAAQPYPEQNCVCCFVDTFTATESTQPVLLHLTADTRYAVYCNGTEIGRGPIRSRPEHWFYDTYDITPWVHAGPNHLAVRVWNYGISNYQALAHAPGLRYEVHCQNAVLAQSGTHTRAAWDAGFCAYTVKRNANMGFMEHYDARRFEPAWLTQPAASAAWGPSTVVPDTWGTLYKRPVKPFHTEQVYPKRVVALAQTEPGCQQVSVNLRPALFAGRQDINATIFTGFLATVLEAPADMDGTITFPCRTWNGILGDFKLDGVLYPVCNEHRAVAVHLKRGKQLFLMQISGKFDDLFCHMEFAFAKAVHFVPLCAQAPTPFVAVGPTQRIMECVDGRSEVYGGLDEFDRFPAHTAQHEAIFAAATQSTFEAFVAQWHFVPENAVFYDEYIYSLVRTARPVQEFALTASLDGVLWNNGAATELCVPQPGNAMCLTLDFENIYVGALEFTLAAPAGTVLELYGFENRYGGEIDFTVGLNNSTRYVCREGCQTYRCLARTGLRYLAVRVSGHTRPVQLYSISVQHATYAASGAGTFRCSDAALQQIWQAAKHTHTLCMEDTFTDCPTYEQAFWIGDAQVSASVNAVLYGEYALMRHCLLLTPQMKHNTPLVNALGPTDWDTNIPMWTMNWLLAIEQYVGDTADDSVYRTLYKDIRAVLDTYASLIEPNGLFVINSWNMLDWAPMDIGNHCAVTGQQAILAYCYGHYAGVASKLGFAQDSKRYLDCRRRLLKGIDTHLWNDATQMFLDGYTPGKGASSTVSIQTHLLLLLFDGIEDVQKRALTRAYVAQPPREFLAVGSPFMLFYLYEVFAREGKFSDVVQDMKARWGAMLRYNCTTCWEVFPGFYEVGRTRSYCHSWSSAPVYFANRYLLGVQKAENGYRKVRLFVPDAGLSWCEGSLPTPFGTLEVRWQNDGTQKRFSLRAPAAIEVDTSAMQGWQVELVQR